LLEFFGFRNGFIDIISEFILIGVRWYQPKIGRWISEDPLLNFNNNKGINSFEEFSNLYGYCRNNPVNLVDVSGLLPGDIYSTADEAAIAAINEINDTSIGLNREFIGRIYGLPTGGFSYTVATQGKMKTANVPVSVALNPQFYGVPVGSYDAGIYHTHGKRNKNYKDFQFSGKGADIGVALQNAIPMYLGTPFHSISKYTPAHWPKGKIKISDFTMIQGPKSPSDYSSGFE